MKKMIAQIASGLIISGFCFNAMAAPAARGVPDKHFLCQVVTETGKSGLVMIQTYTREEAEEKVVGKHADTRDIQRETAVSVVQCIQKFTDERFSDLYFQDYVDNTEG